MTRLLIAIVVLTGLLAGCGVRGKPQAPEGTKTNDPIVLDPLIQ